MAKHDTTILHFLHMLTKNNTQAYQLLKTSTPRQRSVLRKICNLVYFEEIPIPSSERKKLRKITRETYKKYYNKRKKNIFTKLLRSNVQAKEFVRNRVTIYLVVRIFLSKKENYAKIGLCPYEEWQKIKPDEQKTMRCEDDILSNKEQLKVDDDKDKGFFLKNFTKMEKYNERRMTEKAVQDHDHDDSIQQ
jgi:hypothetical protein